MCQNQKCWMRIVEWAQTSQIQQQHIVITG